VGEDELLSMGRIPGPAEPCPIPGDHVTTNPTFVHYPSSRTESTPPHLPEGCSSGMAACRRRLLSGPEAVRGFADCRDARTRADKYHEFMTHSL
ncbi:hypothetical protein AVEN_78805-1, partial [Araneus ventricosus]